MVDLAGLEPATSWMPFKRSPRWAKGPDFSKASTLYYIKQNKPTIKAKNLAKKQKKLTILYLENGYFFNLANFIEVKTKTNETKTKNFSI